MQKRVILLMIVCLAMSSLSIYGEENKTLGILYFYNNPCGACDVESEFYKVFNEQVGDLKESVPYKLRLYNTFKIEDKNYFKKVCGSYGIIKEEQYSSILIIGEKYLVGEEQIKEEMRKLFKEQAGLMPEFSVEEKESVEISKEIEKIEISEDINPEDSYLVYFYTASCGDCKKTKALLEGLEDSYRVTDNGEKVLSDVMIETNNIGELEGTELINAYFKKYQVPEKDQQVPIIFYQEGYLSGYEAIEKGLLEVIETGKALDFNPSVTKEEVEPLTVKDFPKLLLTGLVNGFNPCSISMLLLLLSLMSVGSPILKLGLTYILGKAITYLALGTVLYSLIATLNTVWFQSIQGIINGGIVIFLLGLAMMNILDFLAAKGEEYSRIKLQLPIKLREFNHKLIKQFAKKSHSRYAVIGIFVLGVTVSAGEFLCTGQIYLATILYLIRRMETYSMMTFLALFIYVMAMIIPLVVIILVIYKGKKVLAVSEAIRKNMTTIKLVNAMVFLIFALLIMLL